jgi:anti-sigma regulatory factor (Ser/Thr protein kinase)
MGAQAAPISLRTDLPFTSKAPSVAREQLRGFASGVRPAIVDDAALMVSELVTNALVHGEPEITLRLWRDADSLTVAVDDQGGAPLTHTVPPADQEHGRGLVVVDTLAAHWGVTQNQGDGKQVWFDLATT